MRLTKLPMLSDLRTDARALFVDLRDMFRLHWELARLEIQSDLIALRRLAVTLCIGLVAALTALPLLLTSLAEALDGRLKISSSGWLLIFSLILLGTAAFCAYRGWRWLHKRAYMLQETLEELREDLDWLKQGSNTESPETDGKC